jgi:replicative DNA helicase Mcm
MSFSTSNTNQKKRISPKDLVNHHKAGFKLVPLSEDHVPAVNETTPIYENPNYWNINDFNDPKIVLKFKNVATTLGKTHIKDSKGNDLYIQVLDIDSENAFTLVNTPLCQLVESERLISRFYSIFKDSWNISEKEFSEYTILHILKMFTFVTKTRKKHGYHFWWLSHNQNMAIRKNDCKIESVFEILTDKQGLCTLPPSTHRDDKKFNYSAIGITDKILLSDDFYPLFIELFKDCLRDDCSINKNKVNENRKIENKQKKNVEFYDLSEEAIQTTVEYLLPYYIEHDRNNFVLAFSGMTFYSQISETSAKQIIIKICDKSNDSEKKNRETVLQSTYKKGQIGQPITGAPSLADLIVNLKGYDKHFANNFINNLKTLWKNDVYHKQNPKYKKGNLVPRELSIGQAKREKSGLVKVKGTIIGLTPVYNMIVSVELCCDNCGYDTNIDFDHPIFKLPYKDKSKCPFCPKGQNPGNSLSAILEYISVVDIELQDLETFSEIERLSVKVFEKNTFDVVAGEVVNITGELRVIRKNDNPNNKLETVLFADTIEYERRKEFVLTDKDIQEIEDWMQKIQNEYKNPIDEVVKLFAPELIDLDRIKKGVLLVCANAGFRNIDNRLPKRQRINALLIGDPGLAKTTILEKATKLVPNSQYAGGQSSTGLSLTSQISKEDGGMYTLRFGPVVLAKNSLCCINELGQLPLSEHKHLLDTMEENGHPMAKYGFSTFIEAHPSIIASANPLNNKWQNEDVASFAEFPTLSQIIDRFDLIFVLREKKDPQYLQRYAEEKKKVSENYKAGLYDGNEEFIRKYILHTRNFKPVLTSDAFSLLKEYFINMGYAGISGLARKFDSLLRITLAIAKLKLKNMAEIDDAEEAMMFYNEGLKSFNLATQLVTRPRDRSFLAIKEIIKENNGSPIFLTDAAIEASKRNQEIKYHLLGQGKLKNNSNIDSLRLNNSHALQEILILLRNDTNVQIIKEKPITLRWVKSKENEQINDEILHLLDKDYKGNFDTKAAVDSTIREFDKQKNQNVVDKMPSLVTHECEEYDVCDDNKTKSIEIIPVKTNTSIIDTPSLISENAKNDEYSSNKSITNEVNNFTTSINQTSTINITADTKKDNNSNEILRSNQNPLSHTSHTSHSNNENSSDIQHSGNSDNEQDVNCQHQLAAQIRLKHSPNAEVFTNEDIQKVTESKRQQSATDNPSTYNCNTK